MRNIGNAFVKMGQFQDAVQSYESVMDGEGSPDIQTGFNLVAIEPKDDFRQSFVESGRRVDFLNFAQHFPIGRVQARSPGTATSLGLPLRDRHDLHARGADDGVVEVPGRGVRAVLC